MRLETLASQATEAALDVIDWKIPESRKPDGPCGDALASKLRSTILEALQEHCESNKRCMVDEVEKEIEEKELPW